MLYLRGEGSKNMADKQLGLYYKVMEALAKKRSEITEWHPTIAVKVRIGFLNLLTLQTKTC